MHIKRVLFLCVLSVGLLATAQKSLHAAPLQAAQSPGEVSRNAGPIAIRGCIDGGKQGYTVTQQNTGASFELQGDASRFASLLGKPVEITGQEAPPSGNSGATPRLPKLVVNELHAIAGQCPFTAGAGNAVQTTATPTTVPGPNTQNATTRNAAPTAATPRYEAPGAPNQTPPSVGNNPNVQGASGVPSPGNGNPPAREPSSSAPPPLS